MTKFSVIFFIGFFISGNLLAQNLNKAERHIYEGEFDKADEVIKKYIKNNPLSCCGYYYNALLIFQKTNSGNLQDPSKVDFFYQVYSKLDSAKIYRNSPESSKEIDDIKFTEEKNELKDPSFFAKAYSKAYDELKVKVDNQFLNSLSYLKDEGKLNYYLKLISTNKIDVSGNLIGNFKYESEIVKIRDQVAFDNAKTANSENSFADYQSKYPNSLLFKQAQELKIEASYKSSIQMLTEKSLTEFIDKYSENKILTNICKYKKDSLLFKKAQITITKASIQQFISTNSTSVYRNWAEFLLDSIKSSELIQGANVSEIESYLYSYPSSSYYNDLLCKLKEVKFNSLQGSTNITVLSQFYNEYLGANESNFLVTYKNKKTGEIKDFTVSEANSLLEKDWVLIRTKQGVNSTCGNDYYYLRDTLYNKVTRLRKAVLKIATQNQPLDMLVFKTTSGKLLKHQMSVNDPVQGNVYVQINVNVSPIESILKAISAVQNTDQLCFFAFNDSHDALGYRSYFPGLLNSNYAAQFQNSISVKLSGTEISSINSITKNTYVGNPSAFYYLDNIWNKNPDSQSNVDVHKINFTLTSGYSLTILFTKNYFFITADDDQIDQSMLSPQKWSNKSVDEKFVGDRAKQKVIKYREKLYLKGGSSKYEKAEMEQSNSSYISNTNNSNFEIIISDEIHDNSEVYTVVEEMPEFPGGSMGMMQYLQNNIVYPKAEKEAGIRGKVFVKFVVRKDGSIGNVDVIKVVPGGDGLSQEAIRVIKSMPKWKPGKLNGKAVSVYYNLPINFNM